MSCSAGESGRKGCSCTGKITNRSPEESESEVGNFQRFCQQLSEYEEAELKMMCEYFRDDLIFIMEAVNTWSLLSELTSRTQLSLETYADMKTQRGSSQFSYHLFQYIFDGDKKAITGLFETLYILKRRHPHPNLISLLDEVISTGPTIIKRINLEINGYSLCQEWQEIQENHKEHLLKKTQTLVEFRPPRCNLERECFNLADRFVNLVVVLTDTFRQHSENELIDTGIKHEDFLHKVQKGLEFIAPSRLFCWCYRLKCVPTIVMVSGVPGVGKTTFVQKFVYDWVQKKLCQRFAFVFFFKFRNLNNLGEKKISLDQIILDEYPYLESQIDNIFKEPEKLLFIFDGLDESVHNIHFTACRFCPNPKSLENFSTIVVSLVGGVLLKGCSVLITSRPAKLYSINTDAFQRIVEIMGFFSEERQIYFKQFFNNNEEQTQRALNYVKNDTLYTFCYIPSYCWIICTVLSRSMQPTSSGQPMLPKTITQLFVTFVANILSSHCQDTSGARELCLSIGKMAEHGVLNHILVYEERDLRLFNVDVNSQLLSNFVMESGDPPNVTFSFLHLIIQEFLAALRHYLDYSQGKLNKSLEDAMSYQDCRGEMFIRFLCGLSDNATSCMLKSYFGELSLQASINVIKWLQSFVQTVEKDNKRRLIYVLFCLFETRNKALVLESLGSNTSFDFSGFHLTPLHCAVLAFILEACRETEKLNLESCNIKNEGLERLAPVLHTVRDLSLSVNCLEKEAISYIRSALSHPECKLQSLNLAFSCLEDSYVSDLADGIRCNRSLRSLNLTSNKLEGPSFGDLVTALSSTSCKIEDLKLRDLDLTSGSCSLLTSVINNNPSLKKLDLSANNFCGPQFGDLMEAVSKPSCRIEELLLVNTGLIDECSSQLASAIRNNRYLRKLDLSDNKLAGPQFGGFMEALHSPTCRVEELDLSNNGLTNSSCLQLASGIRSNQSLRKLILSYNNLSGPHFSQLIDALSNPGCRIKQLIFHKKKFTDEEIQSLKTLELEVQDLKISFG